MFGHVGYFGPDVRTLGTVLRAIWLQEGADVPHDSVSTEHFLERLAAGADRLHALHRRRDDVQTLFVRNRQAETAWLGSESHHPLSRSHDSTRALLVKLGSSDCGSIPLIRRSWKATKKYPKIQTQLNDMQNGDAQRSANSAEASAAYSVELLKGAYGLGIYFAAASGAGTAAGPAVVDTRVPFYRLPTGALAPGEASGAIAPGDALLAVNDCDVSSLRFPQIVEELRHVPRGPVTLVFRRQSSALEKDDRAVETTEEGERKQEQTQQVEGGEEDTRAKGWGVFQRLSASAAAVAAAVPVASSPSVEASALQTMESKLRELEDALAREQKCRFLAERKNVLYRNELLRVSQGNTALRDQVGHLRRAKQRHDAFVTSALHLAI
ncbi:hypothetical protein BBJ28_00017861 [Nothophytophthora sp. Chile5]|nr:hypothetical protein BBJ28_00017861 [Nothophytophthora sp. Chile5]